MAMQEENAHDRRKKTQTYLSRNQKDSVTFKAHINPRII